MSETALETQTAAPPAVPPKRPLVGIAMADDAGSRPFHDMRRRFEKLRRQIEAALAGLSAMGHRTRQRSPDV